MDAIVKRLEIIGEAATEISDEYKRTQPQVDWKNISAFRNILVHRYWSVDLAVVWDILRVHLPELIRQLKGS